MKYRIYYERNGVEETLECEPMWALDHNSAVMEIYNVLTDEPYSRQVPRSEDSIEYTFFSAGVDMESVRFEAVAE